MGSDLEDPSKGSFWIAYMLLEMGDIITTGSCYLINDYYVQGALLNAFPDFIKKKKNNKQT